VGQEEPDSRDREEGEGGRGFVLPVALGGGKISRAVHQVSGLIFPFPEHSPSCHSHGWFPNSFLDFKIERLKATIFQRRELSIFSSSADFAIYRWAVHRTDPMR
jgi:hypothetical protein